MRKMLRPSFEKQSRPWRKSQYSMRSRLISMQSQIAHLQDYSKPKE